MDLPENPQPIGPPPPLPPRPNQFGYPSYGGQSLNPLYPQYNTWRPNSYGVSTYGYSPYGGAYSPYGQSYGEAYSGKKIIICREERGVRREERGESKKKHALSTISFQKLQPKKFA